MACEVINRDGIVAALLSLSTIARIQPGAAHIFSRGQREVAATPARRAVAQIRDISSVGFVLPSTISKIADVSKLIRRFKSLNGGVERQLKAAWKILKAHSFRGVRTGLLTI
jgi:hypothetical protein